MHPELGWQEIAIRLLWTVIAGTLIKMTPAEFQRMTEVTYLGYVWGTLAALKRMRPRNKGTIIQVASALAYRGIPLQSAYCGAKHAIRGFTDSLRCELIHDKKDIHICIVEMPAVNTPQFEWVRSRLSNRAQPVPPIYQPEVAAQAIVYAATAGRREIYVGGPTVEAIVGNKIAPGWLDHHLARTGYDSQQTDEPKPLNQPDNLFQPVKGEFGAHGRFDSRSRKFSAELWLSEHRGVWVTALVILLAAILVGAFFAKTRGV